MDPKDKKLLYQRFGLALLKIVEERKRIYKANKENNIKDHKLVSSLRKLSSASGVDYGTVQKITKGDQGLEFFTFIDLIDALGLDMIKFSQYFYSITDDELVEYQKDIYNSRKENAKKKLQKKNVKKANKKSK